MKNFIILLNEVEKLIAGNRTAEGLKQLVDDSWFELAELEIDLRELRELKKIISHYRT